MSSESNVKQLVTDLDHSLGDSTRIDQEFDEVVEVLGRLGWWTEVTLVTLTAETGEYSRPTNALSILSVFYDNRELGRENIRSLEAWAGPQWRDDVGTPISWTEDTLNDGTFRLYPVPSISSKNFIFALGASMGVNYPEYAAAVLSTIRKPIAFQVWFEMLAALRLTEMEFAREGKNQDANMAAACRAVGDLVQEFLT